MACMEMKNNNLVQELPSGNRNSGDLFPQVAYTFTIGFSLVLMKVYIWTDQKDLLLK